MHMSCTHSTAWDDGVVATELGIYVHGDPGEIDAGKVLSGLRHVLDLLKHLEDTNTRGRPGRSTWRFTTLGLSSIDTGIAVLTPRPGASDDDIDAVLQLAVDGLALAEAHPEIHRRWSPAAVESARKVSVVLGSVTDRGVRLTMTRNSSIIAQAQVTVQTERNISSATSERRRSYGSVIGTLDAVNIHGRREATLWTDLHEHRVSIKFSPELLGMVRSAIGKRVEASGTLWRDYQGIPVSLELRRITELPTRSETPPLTQLAGAWARDTS